jgi:hypothetical protein
MIKSSGGTDGNQILDFSDLDGVAMFDDIRWTKHWTREDEGREKLPKSKRDFIRND